MEVLTRNGSREVFPDVRAEPQEGKEPLHFDDNGFFQWEDDKVSFSWMAPTTPFRVTPSLDRGDSSLEPLADDPEDGFALGSEARIELTPG